MSRKWIYLLDIYSITWSPSFLLLHFFAIIELHNEPAMTVIACPLRWADVIYWASCIIKIKTAVNNRPTCPIQMFGSQLFFVFFPVWLTEHVWQEKRVVFCRFFFSKWVTLLILVLYSLHPCNVNLYDILEISTGPTFLDCNIIMTDQVF